MAIWDNGLGHLCEYKNFRAERESSYDRNGRNDDFITIGPGETKCIADLNGPGVITHIWFTVDCSDEQYLRKLLLRVYWDGQDIPSIESPLGDFFGLGHAYRTSYQCAIFSTSAAETSRGGGVALNCWLPMPFNEHARFEIVNDCETQPVNKFYFYIDYQSHPSLLGDIPYLHAHWRRELPAPGWTGKGSVWGTREHLDRTDGPDGANLSDEHNYKILETTGRGHYVGCNMSIRNLAQGWWGEGDDMIFVDNEPWPPSLHGTGTEDYFGHAWGMQNNAFLYHGTSLWVPPFAGVEFPADYRGLWTVYRYHLLDPIPFSKSIRVSIEHGHANDRSDDISSVAYWYQSLPAPQQQPMPSVKERLGYDG